MKWIVRGNLAKAINNLIESTGVSGEYVQMRTGIIRNERLDSRLIASYHHTVNVFESPILVFPSEQTMLYLSVAHTAFPSEQYNGMSSCIASSSCILLTNGIFSPPGTLDVIFR